MAAARICRPGVTQGQYEAQSRGNADRSSASSTGWLHSGIAHTSHCACEQVSDRTKTPEELAELERARLEALEKQRLKRMTAAADAEAREGEEPAGEPALATGGYAARRQKRQKLVLDAENGPSGENLMLQMSQQSVKSVLTPALLRMAPQRCRTED